MQSHSSSPVNLNRLFIWILILGTFVLYAPTLFFQFIYYDDNTYVFENAHIQAGLSPTFFKWFLTAFVSANWHPLTLLSHAIDWQLYGLWAGGHHLTNVIFHVLNALLVFILFFRMTGSPGKAFLIAALFAWHPVKVESVAWIAERKDVLSTFFILLALLTYTAYARDKEQRTKNKERLRKNFVLCSLFFVLSLLCKPMYVTLPIVLLFLDYWPLNRNESWAKRLLEKVPFIILSAISSFVTIHTQAAGGAINHFSDYPVLVRFANISQAYWDYILLFLWPAKLSIFYPYVPNAHVGQSLFIGFIFVLITGVFYFRRKQSPAIWTGWCLFGIMLIPVIGVITIGAHWIACRYLYGPAIGLSIMLVWGGEALLSKLHFPKKIIYIFSAVLLAGYVSVTSVYLGVWQNSYKLFKHAEKTIPNNWIAHVSLRAAYGRDGDNLKAAEHLIEAIRVFPDVTNRISLHWLDFYYMGQVKLQSGQMMQSESYLRESARRLSEIKPDNLFSDSLTQRKNLSACLAAFDSGHPKTCKL